MRRMLISSFTLVALVACSSADRSTGPSPADGADPTTGPSLAHGGNSLVTRPLSGRCTTVVARIAPPPIEIQSIEYTCQISHLGRTTPSSPKRSTSGPAHSRTQGCTWQRMATG